MHRILLVIVFLVVIFGAYQLILSQNTVQNPGPIINPPLSVQSSPGSTLNPTPTGRPTPTKSASTPASKKPEITGGSVLLDVPFIAQAPFAEWSDPRQQDGCEEASVVMAMHWVKGEKIASKEAGKEEILKLSHYQEDNYGEYHDSSAQDTADRMIKGYYKYNNFEVLGVNSADDLISQLEKGNLIIIPSNGRALGNPNFTQPGPERHMLVIKGFDPAANQFITNDPGIRQGENWKYKKDVLFNSIRDYPSGYHKPITGDSKMMIVIKK